MKTKQAKESSSVKRLRERLKKHLDKQESLITQESLSEVSHVIKEMLQRRESKAPDLKKKSVTLFDANRHPAKDGKATERLRAMIKKDYFRQ